MKMQLPKSDLYKNNYVTWHLTERWFSNGNIAWRIDAHSANFPYNNSIAQWAIDKRRSHRTGAIKLHADSRNAVDVALDKIVRDTLGGPHEFDRHYTIDKFGNIEKHDTQNTVSNFDALRQHTHIDPRYVRALQATKGTWRNVDPRKAYVSDDGSRIVMPIYDKLGGGGL